MYTTELIDGGSPKRDEAAPLLVLGFEPMVTFRNHYPWYEGMSIMAGWGGPLLRRNVSAPAEHLVAAVGAFVGYAWSRTLALEFRPRFMAAPISHATLDGGGLVSFAPDRITFTLHVPLVVRFDDIVSY